MQDIIRNIILGIALAAPIGPAGVAVIQAGLRRGFPTAFLTGIGITLADTTYLLVVFFGLSNFMNVSTVKIFVWIFGAVVLIYLGLQNIRDAWRGINLERNTDTASRHPLLVGYLVNISNPIAIVWWIGIFGTLLSTSTHETTRLRTLLISSTILIGILSWHFTVSVLTHWGKRFLNERTTKYIALIAGIALILFGVRFGYNALLTALQ